MEFAPRFVRAMVCSILRCRVNAGFRTELVEFLNHRFLLREGLGAAFCLVGDLLAPRRGLLGPRAFSAGIAAARVSSLNAR